MSSKIDGYSNTAAAAGLGRATPLRAGSPAAQAKPGAAATDSVQLTGDARLLQQVEKDVAASPDIDQAKVSALRQTIAEGRYRPDADAIAGKLLRSEWELGGHK